MIEISSFEAEITDFADVFIGPERKLAGRDTDPSKDEPFLFVVLPSFAFKVRLTPGNLALLRLGVEKWLPSDSG